MPGTNSSRSYLQDFTVIFFSAEAMDRLLQCATHALPYFSASVGFFHKDIEYLGSRKNIDRLLRCLQPRLPSI